MGFGGYDDGIVVFVFGYVYDFFKGMFVLGYLYCVGNFFFMGYCGDYFDVG